MSAGNFGEGVYGTRKVEKHCLMGFALTDEIQIFLIFSDFGLQLNTDQ
jgi:hypothetical protein